MFHKLEHGDILKMLPVVTSDNVAHHVLQTYAVYLNNKWIYDTKGYLNELHFRTRNERRENGIHNNPVSTRFWCAVLINNEVKFISFGRKIRDIMHCEYNKAKSFGDYINNRHLLIDIENKQCGNMILPSYDKSTFIEKDCDIPISDVNDLKEWIRQSQPFYLDKHLDKNGLMANYDLVNKSYNNKLSEIIEEKRDKKIDEILK